MSSFNELLVFILSMLTYDCMCNNVFDDGYVDVLPT